MKMSINWITSAFAAMAIILFTTNVKAQTRADNLWHLGIGLEAGTTTGDLNGFSNFELGGTARLQYNTQSDISVMFTSGYYNVFAKEIAPGLRPSDVGIVPLKAGIKIFTDKSLYFSAEAGAGLETNYARNTKLIVSPGIGYACRGGPDVGLRYESFSAQNDNYGLVGLRLAYGFKL